MVIVLAVVNPVAEQAVCVSQLIEVTVLVSVPEMLSVSSVEQLVAVTASHVDVDVVLLDGSSVLSFSGSGSLAGGSGLR